MKRATKLCALLLAVLAAPGCATLKKLTPGGGPPPWCKTVQDGHAFAVSEVYPLLDLQATKDPELDVKWTPLRADIEEALVKVNALCVEPGVTEGDLGGWVATAANLISNALKIYGSFAGSRELRAGGQRYVEVQARMEQLQVEVGRRTGARAAEARSRALGRR